MTYGEAHAIIDMAETIKQLRDQLEFSMPGRELADSTLTGWSAEIFRAREMIRTKQPPVYKSPKHGRAA